VWQPLGYELELALLRQLGEALTDGGHVSVPPTSGIDRLSRPVLEGYRDLINAGSVEGHFICIVLSC